MSNKLDYLEKICDLTRQQCRTAFPALDLEFIVHHPGQLEERLALAERTIKRNRAGRAARSIIEKTMMTDRSSVLGLAVQSHKFFGFYNKNYYLGLININTDDITDSRQARHLAYHLAWHVIDMMKSRGSMDKKDRFQSGPVVPKRSSLEMAMANMKADIFGAMMNTLQGHTESIQQLAHMRAHESTMPYIYHRVEDYPYVIAAEAAQYAYSDLQKRGSTGSGALMHNAYAFSLDVAKSFDETHIRQWHGFASAAQNMAWAGHSQEEILGAAVNTSENAYIRATGYLVAQFAGIVPLSASSMMSRYNSFTSFERNERLHRERMESMFEAALAKSLEDNNGISFKEAANIQNEELAQGSILGWCASALQSAGQVFDIAVRNEMQQAAELARDKFNDEKDQNDWGNIVKLGEKIIDHKREGYAVTLGQVAELCRDMPDLSAVAKSLRKTINDPAYAQKLMTANDAVPAALKHYSRAVPRAAAAPRSEPSLAPMSMPMLPGLGGSTSQMVRARMIAREKRMLEQQNQDQSE